MDVLKKNKQTNKKRKPRKGELELQDFWYCSPIIPIFGTVPHQVSPPQYRTGQSPFQASKVTKGYPKRQVINKAVDHVWSHEKHQAVND